MINAIKLSDCYAGIPAAILGGGPSLPEDLRRLPQETILISVNDHALHFCNPDYLVFMDIPNTQILPELARAVETFSSGLLVSPTPLSDIDLSEVDYWDGGFTSALATWFADFMGCSPILLCGMDCYQGEEKYCHPRPDFYHPVMDYPLDMHLQAWSPAFVKCPHAERIRAVSGPLTKLFGGYDVARD